MVVEIAVAASYSQCLHLQAEEQKNHCLHKANKLPQTAELTLRPFSLLELIDLALILAYRRNTLVLS